MSRPQKRKSAVRQVGVFMMVDTSAVFRTFFFYFFGTLNFLEKKKSLVIKIWQLLAEVVARC